VTVTGRQHRLLSYTEVETAMTCFARWDFAYGGRLAGSTLKPRQVAAVLSEGRAWGEAVAAWHRASGTLTAPLEAQQALLDSLAEEADRLKELGLAVPMESRVMAERRLMAVLDHYMATAEPLPNLTRTEDEIVVPVPSRGGKRGSTHYRFLAKIDGWTDSDGVEWIVEFKLRGRLTPVWLVELSRQPLWYAWAESRLRRRRAFGVIVEERLNEAPKPALLTEKGKVPSHKKEQLTTPERYVDLCREYDVEPKQDTIDALAAREWQKRIPLAVSEKELAEAGRELVTAAKLIRDLDRGELMPVRNAKPGNCNGCKFRRVCKTPDDASVVDLDFERTVPKRLREPIERSAA
jgi:hypothetical protein